MLADGDGDNGDADDNDDNFRFFYGFSQFQVGSSWWEVSFITTFKQQHSFQAERRRREVRRCEHPKMYPPDCIFAPRSC